MNRRRLEVEAWRDAMLAAAGTLDPALGGPSTDLSAPDNRRRTFYGAVSRHDLNPLLRLFDFPDPNITADKRPETTVPLQQLFVLNSEFMVRNAKALAGSLAAAEADDADRIRRAFVRLYGRPATDREVSLGLAFLVSTPGDGEKLSRWEQYAQALWRRTNSCTSTSQTRFREASLTVSEAMMNPYFRPTRRDLLRIGGGFGALALSRVFADAGLLAAESPVAHASGPVANPLAPKAPHFAPRAKRLIFLFMNGGPSHPHTLDPQPAPAQ